MSRQQAFTPDHLFDRPWRPGRRFAPGAGRARRWLMIGLLVVLCLVIGAYSYLTDADRVRGMAEQYLSSLVGGPVKVGGATLSVFEGLRLDDVRVFVDDQQNSPDSLLFSAQTFLIKYDPRTMIAGRLEATQIVAQKPQVHLAENRDVGEWNYERLARRRRHAPAGPPGVPGKPRVLPEVLLRNARVVISEIRGGEEVARGLMAVDGRLATTADADRYAFHLQSRGASEGIGPYATGSVSLSTGNVVARLMNFEFDRDVRSMLPVEPREWWQRHELAGAVSMPEISFTPGRSGAREQFKLVTILNGVTLSVSPEEWMGRAEVTRLAGMRKTTEVMGGLFAYAGKRQSSNEDVAVDSLGFGARNLSTPQRLAQLLRPGKVTLKNVAGTFVFTNGGIEVKDVSGFIESNGLKINGRIDGYRPDATMSLSLASFDTENLTIPASPRYINSLPREVREVYEQFKPEGEARIAVRVERPEPGARPEVAGSIQILDGRFNFHRFAYPLRNVTGRIDFGRGTDGVGRLSLNVRGNGIANGPNRDTVLEIKTFGDGIAPIGTNICGVNVRISGQNVASEDALRDAFAPEVRQALAQFDAHRTGKYPQFRGDFVTEVVRPVGLNRRWTFDTDIKLRGASGALAAFPYPLHDLSGTLRIRNGYAEFDELRMTRGGGGKDAATLSASGRVAWTTSDGPRGPQPPYRARDAMLSPRIDEPVKTDIKVAVRNLPIDNDLLSAIPAEPRAWVRKLGATGKLDVDGRVFPGEAKDAGKVEWVVGGKDDAPAAPDAVATAQDINPAPSSSGDRGPAMAYDLKLTVRDGTLRPFGGAFEATRVAAAMRLTPDRLAIEKVTGRRGDGELSTTGAISWPHGKARVALDAAATALPLDAALYELLPDAGRQAWDATQPEGTLDATVHYDSAALDAERARSLAAQPVADASAPGLRIALKPRKLAVTLKAAPYRLDSLSGDVRSTNNKVTIDNIVGRHGDAKVTVDGTGVLAAASSVWDLRLSGEGMTVDDELRAALPATLAGLIESIKLQGKVGFNLTRFVHRSTDAPATPAPTPVETDAPQTAPAPTPAEPEIDLAGSISLAGASLDVGVPLTDVVGDVKLDASVRNGHLDTLRGGLDFASMNMAGRPGKNFRADLFKPAGRSELSFSKMRGQIADGAMSGRMTLVYPDDGASRYALELVVRDADVRALAWEEDAKVSGRLTASLSLEGSWGDAGQRRGRGDVMVAGKELKRIPLVLGLLQVTNLALPISSPFNEATAVYSLDGSRVFFESIRLKSPNMLMEGNGSLDFTDKRVDLAFTTDNPNDLLNIPFLKDIWRGARNEMLKINIRGTIQEPEVSAQSMGTFWTTVDEVFNGDRRADVSDKKRKGK